MVLTQTTTTLQLITVHTVFESPPNALPLLFYLLGLAIVLCLPQHNAQPTNATLSRQPPRLLSPNVSHPRPMLQNFDSTHASLPVYQHRLTAEPRTVTPSSLTPLCVLA
ncbi:hypothetical protein K443DRAFT_681585 [Laccaria amethystina LaAM-08-1]|uniref:Uncharacterized protein n=1 Tax=Laccaria amethystina LaAM-08-1 TaxID=1095629 RepID=A0A0C9X7N5_9AGAR|nr:hypothetical protein K443DRAFT_681585 [Laccaria amethystina LaAM-08-1]